ncbi:MAG TPA: hypothetical protein VF950_19380 [Planctomycetota bacterium]
MPEEPKDIGKIIRDGVLIERALHQAARQACEDHKRTGLPLAIWRDGRVAWVSPEEFERGLARSKPA